MHLSIIFKEIVAKYPDKIALKFENSEITYHELDLSSNALMLRFYDMGIQNNSRIGLLINNPVLFINSIIALIKLSAIYIPFDVKHSIFLISEMCEIAKADMLLYDLPDYADQLNNIKTKQIDLNLDAYIKKDYSNIKIDYDSDSILYIMFTSGTMGNPKGVMIKHSGISRFKENDDIIKISSDDVFLQSSSIAFDASSYEIWLSLLNGATLVLLNNKFEFKQLESIITDLKISIIFLTTRIFETLVAKNHLMFKELKYLIFGGEVCNPKIVKDAYKNLPEVKLIHAYGPTENTIFTLMHEVDNKDLNRNHIPIGFPVGGTECYLLDIELQNVNNGELGVLYAAGEGLADSYTDELLTLEKFIKHTEINKRLYNTGDVVRYNPEYGYEFIGRNDRQIKIRGYRIELQDIEYKICNIQNVLHSYVLYDQVKNNKELFAFYTTQNKIPLDTAYIKNELSKKLPSYSIPNYIEFVDELPFKTTGKVDLEKLLSKISISQFDLDEKNIDLLKEIWINILKTKNINDSSDFFELGGDSIKSLDLLYEVEKAFNISLSSSYLINHKNFGSFKKDLFKEQKEEFIIELKKGENSCPFFFIPWLNGDAGIFVHLAKRINTEQAIYSFALIPFNADKVPSNHIKNLAVIYASYITNFLNTKEVVLCGSSIGGNIAWQLNFELLNYGIKTKTIHLFDTPETNFYVNTKNIKFNNKRLLKKYFLNINLLYFLIYQNNLKPIQYKIENKIQPNFNKYEKISFEYNSYLKKYRKFKLDQLYTWKNYIINIFSNNTSLIENKTNNYQKVWYYLMSNHEDKPIKDIPVYLYRSEIPLIIGWLLDEKLGWSEKATNLEIVYVKGEHTSILITEHVEFLAEKFNRCLISQLNIY